MSTATATRKVQTMTRTERLIAQHEATLALARQMSLGTTVAAEERILARLRSQR